MFTGIIEALGTVADLSWHNGDMQLRIDVGKMDLSDVKLGDSIAVNGVCLTAVELFSQGFLADVSRETLAHTRLAQLKIGESVNLEKALQPISRLGGHLVSGHVDGVGEIIERREDARSIRFTLKAPTELSRYIAHKGSITVDGVSLTVNAVQGDLFELNIVPHTALETTLQFYHTGHAVHLEVDLIARYLERLLLGESAHQAAAPSSSELNEETLAAYGFLRR